MSDNGFISRWQRRLRDDPKAPDLPWKVGMALSTFADQYTDPARGYVAGEHARPGVEVLRIAARVSRKNVAPALKWLSENEYIEQTRSGKILGRYYEYKLLDGESVHETLSKVSIRHPGKCPSDTFESSTGDTLCSSQLGSSHVVAQPVSDQAPAAAPPAAAMTDEKKKAAEGRRVVRRRPPALTKSSVWLVSE